MTDEGWPKAQKFRATKANGWTFEPLTESRQAWDQRYGPQSWNVVKEWSEEVPDTKDASVEGVEMERT